MKTLAQPSQLTMQATVKIDRRSASIADTWDTSGMNVLNLQDLRLALGVRVKATCPMNARNPAQVIVHVTTVTSQVTGEMSVLNRLNNAANREATVTSATKKVTSRPTARVSILLEVQTPAMTFGVPPVNRLAMAVVTVRKAMVRLFGTLQLQTVVLVIRPTVVGFPNLQK